MLAVLPDSTPDGIDKRLWFTQALTKKNFKFFPSNKDVGFLFDLMLILLLAK